MSFEDENAGDILDETGQDDEEDGDEAGEVRAAEAPRFGPTDNYDLGNAHTKILTRAAVLMTDRQINPTLKLGVRPHGSPC